MVASSDVFRRFTKKDCGQTEEIAGSELDVVSSSPSSLIDKNNNANHCCEFASGVNPTKHCFSLLTNFYY
jgi:hypothetical protein